MKTTTKVGSISQFRRGRGNKMGGGVRRGSLVIRGSSGSTPRLVLSGSFQRQLGEVSDPTRSLGSTHRPLLPGSPPGGGSSNSSRNRVHRESAGVAMAGQTDRRTDGPSQGPPCSHNLRDQRGPRLLAPPRPVSGTPAREGRRWEGGEEVGGKGSGHPSQPGPGSLSRSSPRQFETGFPDVGGGAGAPKLLSAHGILLRGDPLAADLGARKGSLWKRYPNT